MKRTIKLNERDLSRIVKKVIKENESNSELIDFLDVIVNDSDTISNAIRDYTNELYEMAEDIEEKLKNSDQIDGDYYLDIVENFYGAADAISDAENRLYHASNDIISLLNKLERGYNNQ